MKANSIIHDIRNPLNSIAMNAELGKLVLESGGDTTKAVCAFETILEACRTCSEQLVALKRDIEDTDQ